MGNGRAAGVVLEDGDELDAKVVLSNADPKRTFLEMVEAGITCVGEFHYLHHQPDGTPYDDPNVMGHALQQAAEVAGLRVRVMLRASSRLS